MSDSLQVHTGFFGIFHTNFCFCWTLATRMWKKTPVILIVDWAEDTFLFYFSFNAAYSFILCFATIHSYFNFTSPSCVTVWTLILVLSLEQANATTTDRLLAHKSYLRFVEATELVTALHHPSPEFTGSVRVEARRCQVRLNFSGESHKRPYVT